MSGEDQFGKLTMATGGPGAVSVKPSAKVHNWHTRAATIVFDGILVFLFINLMLYVIIPTKRSAKFPTPLDWYGRDKIMKAYPGWREEDVNTLLRETWKGKGYEYEPFTGFKEIPFHGKFVYIDPAGFRFSKDQAPWPPRPQAMNLFVFGGSTTFGYGLPDDQTIPSYLGDCGVANDSRGRFAVYNFGRGSYFSSQELALFQQLLSAGFVPQVAVFIDGINDFDHADGQPRFSAALRGFMAGHTPLLGPLEKLPAVQAARWLHAQWNKPQPQESIAHADRGVLESAITRWMANKRMIEASGAAFGVRTIFVWQPVPTYKYDRRYDFFVQSAEDHGALLRSEYGYPLMENLRAQGKLGANVLWLADMQQDKHENLYVDAFHYNAVFSKEIAGQICNVLREHAN